MGKMFEEKNRTCVHIFLLPLLVLRLSFLAHCSHVLYSVTHGCQVGIYNALFGKKWTFSRISLLVKMP